MEEQLVKIKKSYDQTIEYGSPEYRIASMIEAHLERPDQYDLSTEEFEALLHDFNIEKVEKVRPMLQYFLTC